jgi:hypothetical protein
MFKSFVSLLSGNASYFALLFLCTVVPIRTETFDIASTLGPKVSLPSSPYHVTALLEFVCIVYVLPFVNKKF